MCELVKVEFVLILAFGEWLMYLHGVLETLALQTLGNAVLRTPGEHTAAEQASGSNWQTTSPVNMAVDVNKAMLARSHRGSIFPRL
jgi:hypothetical protein